MYIGCFFLRLKSLNVQVSETALDTYQDLLQDFDELAQDGWREDGKEYTDSSDDEDTTSMSKRKKRKSDHDDAYSMDIDEGAEQGEEEADVEEDSSAEGSPADSDDIHSPVKASRRSNREAARKRIDYSKQAEYDEEDDEIPESSESSSSESDSSDMPSKMRRANIDSDSDLEVASGPTRGIGRSQASKAARMLLDDENSGAEEFIEGGEKEGDLRAEQLHNPVSSPSSLFAVWPKVFRAFLCFRAVLIAKLHPHDCCCLNISRKRDANERSRRTMMKSGILAQSGPMEG